MFRHRLRGGHKVGAPNNVTRSLPDQTNLSQQTGNLAGPQSQYGASMQPPPQSGPTMDARQVGQQQQTGNNNWAWGGGSSDGAWNWGDSAAWSLKNTNQTTNQHQQLIQQQQQPVLSQQLHQQPPQQYNQHHAYSHLQHTSQQQFPEAVQDVTYSNPHATSTTSTTFHQGHVPTNIPLQPQFQQYVNGDSQNGQGTDEWGADNWGDDWGNTESYNNNNNIPANYVKEENRQKQHQDYHSYPHQEEEEKVQQQVHHGYQQQEEHQHQEYHHQQQYFQPHQQEHEHQQQSPPDACQQQIEIRYEHHPQQELQQQHNTQHHQHMHPQEYNQSLQQSSEKTQQSTEDDWGWGNDDWQVNGQTSERHQENIHQLTSQKPADSQQNLQLTHSSDELALPGEAESGNHSQKSVLPQRTVSRDSPGDGWPDWEAEQLQVPEVVSKLVQQNQVSEEKTTDDSAEKNSTSLQIDEKQGAQSQQLQQWDDGLGHNEFSKCVEDVCAPVSDGYTALQDSGTLPASVSRSNSLSPNNTGLHNINNNSWGQKSNGTSIVQDITGDYVGNEEHQLHFSEKQNVLMQQTQVPSNNTTVSNAPFSPSESCKSQSDVMETAVLDEPPTPVMLNNLDDRWGDGWGERETPQNPEAVDKVDEQNVQKSEDYPDSEQVQLHKGTLQFAEFQLSDNKIDTSVTPVLCNSELYPQDINKHQPREFQAGENKPSEQQEFIDDEYSSRDMTKSEGWDGEWDQEFVITKSMESTQQATVTESYIHEIPKYNVEIASKTLDTLTLLDNPEDVKESHGYPEESFALKYPAQMSQHHHLSHQAHESQLCSTSEEISILDSKSQFQPRAEASSQNYQLGHESFGDLQTAQESCNQIESATQQGTQFHYNSHQRSEELVHQYEPQNCQLKQIYEPQTTYTSEPESRPLLLSEPKQSYQDSQFQPSTTDQPLNQCEAHLPTESSRSYQQYQEVNREIMPAPPVPDPIFSRIPDGASSIPEAPTGIAGVAEDGSNQVLEDVHQPLVKNTSQEVSERPSSSHSVSSPSHPVRPSSSHTLPDRPASNQSAHSVHSTHSAWSSQSAHSTHSVLSQNQEVPLDENSKVHVHQSPINLATQGKESAIEVPTNTASSVDGDTDPTVLPANNPEGPPPVSGPLGVVPSLRARKGSPFQPPTTKLSSPGSFSVQTYQPEVFSPPQTATSNISSVPLPVCPDVGANLETPPDNNEQPSAPQKSGVPLWSSSENVSVGVKLVVAAPMIDTLAPVQPPLSSNAIPLVVPTMIKEEKTETDSCINNQQATIVNPEPPAAHSANSQALVVKPKIQSLSSMPVNPTSPAVLDLSRSSRSKVESRGDGSQDITNTPNFSRMVPGESSKGESTSVSTYQAPSVVPSMPSERVVTGNDNPQPVLPVRIKQEPSEIRSPPDGPYTSDLSSQGASVVPPVRSETIGSEEPTSRNFASANSGSRSDLASDHRVERSGRWERDHSRDGESRSSDRYHDRSREHSRDYYRDRDDSPHSRHSYDRDYDRKYVDDRRRWRRESDDEEDGDRRYYESRDRRERAYRDELDRYSDRPIKEDKDRLHSRDKRRNYGDRSKEYYRSYDEDPYYGRGDRSQPVSRSSSINNLDNDGERSVHSHRSRHDCYDRHDRRDSHSRDSDPRDRDVPYTRDGRERDFLQRGWEPRESRDRRDPRYYNQRGGYQEAYGSREMYDQYQYYYHYYRDHPYYKEYYRQWMKQYGQAYPSESFYDDRTSIHSGRSSVNDELKKSVSSGELSGVPSVADDTTSEAPQRMTPVQFGRPHINAQFTFGGQLALVLPKDPRDGEKALVQLRDVQKMLCMDPGMNRTIQQMKNYPGPLTLSDTHKDVVVKYCEQQVAEAARNLSLPDKESVMLTWEYLALLVKQNGKLYGSDVAGLLLKGREVTAQPQHNNTHVQPENLAPENLASEAGPQDEGTDVQSQAVISTPERDEALLVKKFTEYLCLGRKREAVDYAVQEGLWGHALALSYKMDTTTHTRVLAAFSSSIPSTDVLLTLFQQLSGKRPEITKTYTPLQWGDWRQHLAVMISNPTGHTQRDRASIVTLGDTLATQGQLYAAHFCYLMAEVEWGSYSSKDSKLVLIGASHQLPFQAFATNEAIQCTEVYEFARSLDSSNPLLETFQPYKLVYALRLTEYGFPTEALRYCEVISQLVSKTPASHQTDFLSQVYDLASRLKYHDLHYQMCQGEVSEMPDPQWLTNLKSVINLSKAHISQTATEQDNPQTLQDHQVVQDSGLQLADTTDHNQQVPYSSSGVYPSSFTNSDKSYHHNIDNTSGNSYSQEQDIGRDAFVGQAPPANAVDGVHQNMYASNHLLDSQSPVERVDAQLPSEAGQPSDMVNPSKENASLGEVSMMQPPPQDQMQYMYSGGYLSGYPEQEPIASLYMQRSSLEVTHGSLPPSSDVSGEQRPGSVTLSQPSSLSNYQSYQTWEQHQQVNTDAPGHMPPRSPEPTESELSAHSQRTPEEEAYWAEMSGKKGNNDLKRVDKKSERGNREGCRGETPVQPTKLENRTKRVSFKPQASQTEEKENWAKKEQRTSSAGTTSGTGPRVHGSTDPARPHVSMASAHRHLDQNEFLLGTKHHHFPGRVANIEMMATLPANHPSRVLPPSLIPCTFSSSRLPFFQKLKVPSNPLVFGGSFPIDDPISARHFGTVSCKAENSISTPRTYQVDTICCQAPNLCDEHARLGRDTDIARAEARLHAAAHNDDNEEEAPSHSSSPSASSQNVVCSMPTHIYHPYESHSSNSVSHHNCFCDHNAEPPSPYRAAITYPVDRNVEDGLIPLIPDDDDNYDYQDEECDEFGGDVYEYEDGEEIGSGEPDFEASFQLRYRHQASLVSIGDTADITSTVPSSPPSPLSSPSPQPSHSPASNECEKPLVKGFLPLACPMGPAASTPLFQPPTHPSSQMSSPPPPLLGPNSHMTQSMNSATDTSSKDKSVEGKVMDKDLDKSQDKSGGWSITSLFGWKKSKQAVLPDDKNPTIIWDEEKKKWVNQDGDEEVTSPPPPPPKSVLGGPGTSPHMMTRGGPRKSRYVNTEKDAQGMAGGMPSNLPNPMLLPVPGAPMNINSPSASQPLMVPAPLPPPKEDRDATGSIPQPPHNVGYQEHHQLPLPQTSPGPAPLPEIVQGTLSEGTEGNGSVPMMGQPIGQPQFFNPTQFKTSTNANPSQTRRPGPGRRSLPARR